MRTDKNKNNDVFVGSSWIILALIVLLVLPLLINLLCCRVPVINKIFGEPKGWTMFWGTYIGAIISCLVAYYVLFKQLEQNHKENSDNRKLQIGVIEYQQKTQWLTELKSRLFDFETLFHRSDFDSLLTLFWSTQDTVMEHQSQIMDKINEIYTKASSAILAINTMFTGEKDDFETKSLTFFNGNGEELFAALDDLRWFADNFGAMSPAVPLYDDLQEYHDEINSYESSNHTHSSKSRRIWDIMESLKNRCDGEVRNIIIRTRVSETLRQTSILEIHKAIGALIEHEQGKINDILKADNT